MSFAELTELLTWRDALDVFLVTLVVYNLLLLIRGTRAVQMLTGLLLLVGAYYAARIADLATLQATLEYFFTFLPVAVIVLFQDEIRRALAHIGSRPLWPVGQDQDADAVFSEIVLAASSMSRDQVGGLIVIERLEGLKHFVDNGIGLDADVSYDLLLSIFNPTSPLHDGAVIVQKDRIAAAACYLPLTTAGEISKKLGTRHRAALGVSEQTDAVVVVISEETGRIGIAHQGELHANLDESELRNRLFKLLITDLYPQGGGG